MREVDSHKRKVTLSKADGKAEAQMEVAFLFPFLSQPLRGLMFFPILPRSHKLELFHFAEMLKSILFVLHKIDAVRAALREAEENDRKQTTELRRLREELAGVQGRYASCLCDPRVCMTMLLFMFSIASS